MKTMIKPDLSPKNVKAQIEGFDSLFKTVVLGQKGKYVLIAEHETIKGDQTEPFTLKVFELDSKHFFRREGYIGFCIVTIHRNNLKVDQFEAVGKAALAQIARGQQ